ncbi:MAG: hypothetical protein K0R17_188 [Rariglobus sp.]|jgi:hypothetical protein|nr:hypothetical protein [Rariglobus sp.]
MNTTHLHRRLLAVLGLACLTPFCVHAEVYINETFEGDTAGVAPSDPAQKTASQVLTAAGTGLIGTDNVAHYNDTSTTGGGGMEYNVGSSALGALQISFDLFNNNATASGTAANPLIFGVANWNNSSSTLMGANANRSFGIEFYQVGASSTVRVRNGTSTTVLTGSYDMAAVIKVSIFINDHDTNTLDYTMPGTSTTATLNANSAVIFLNGSLIGTETTAGFVLSSSVGSGNATGDATLGRLGFNSSSTNTPNFLIDNLYVSDISAVPEPSACAAFAGAGVLGLAFWRRRRA